MRKSTVATLFAALISIAAFVPPASAFDLASLFGGNPARIDDCRSGTNFDRCGSGAGLGHTGGDGRITVTTEKPGLPFPPDDCGGNATPQGRVSLGGGVNGQGNAGTTHAGGK